MRQDTRFDDAPRDIPLLRGPDSRNPIRTLRARAVLIDMEEGVVNQVPRALPCCQCLPSFLLPRALSPVPSRILAQIHVQPTTCSFLWLGSQRHGVGEQGWWGG